MSEPTRRTRTARGRWFTRGGNPQPEAQPPNSDEDSGEKYRPPRWGLGILNDRETDEVPGSVLLMSKREAAHNQPLGLRHAPARHSSSSLPSQDPVPSLGSGSSPHRTPQSPYQRPRPNRRASSQSHQPEPKKTANGQIILDPQPDESANDPLNWPAWRRDMALISLGFFCMLGGGMTPILAAGFSNVAATYGVTVPQVSLTTGLYMLGLGIGSVIFSPTAILYGKRPVYLLGGCLFVLSSVWCALSPDYPSLVVARIFQGIAVSPVECLPSATIAEIFFLHERAYRLGIYTLLLLGGKNLMPLVSAAIIQSRGWRWVFWVIGMMVGFSTITLFFFVPETFWDRTPRPSTHKHKNPLAALTALFSPALSRHHSRPSSVRSGKHLHHMPNDSSEKLANMNIPEPQDLSESNIAKRRQHKAMRAHFIDESTANTERTSTVVPETVDGDDHEGQTSAAVAAAFGGEAPTATVPEVAHLDTPVTSAPDPEHTVTALRHTSDYFSRSTSDPEKQFPGTMSPSMSHRQESILDPSHDNPAYAYTSRLATAPPRTYLQTLRPWNGRLRKDNWLKCMVRPFILFAYPAILWSTLVYSLSVGWLIVISESITTIYRTREYAYNFTALQAGLIYISPFIGGVLGTAVAGKVSDVIVRFMSRRNDGVYEPEFRLVMAIPVMLSTSIGLMGFGWSAAERDAWIVPTVFFGIISFGCSLGSTTAITFAVDSYRVYAGEALVTLNFSKNVLHGFIFSLFFTGWLENDGSKTVFLAIGGIQVACLLSTIPMYIFGKRARMWTVRKNMMERF